FSSRRRHTRSKRDWSSDVCSSDLADGGRLGRVSPPVPIFPGHGRREAVPNPEPRRTPMRSFLPMANHVRGKRSPVTCALKCDNACLKATCNTSSNGYFRDIVDAKLSRRAVLGASAAGALAIAVTTAPSPTAGSAAAATAGSLDFTAIDPVHHDVDEFIVPEG